VGLPHDDWQYAVANLREARLLDAEDATAPDALDAHPLVREHFGEQLKRANAAAWREAHGRLYEYYKRRAPELPDTLEAMAPLYAAVAHGCATGRHQEALDDVYWRRIQQRDEFYAAKKLGAFSADLAAVAGFFDPPWRRPVAGLPEGAKAFVLNEAGTRLSALGRLAEAMEPMQASFQLCISLRNWKEAAIRAAHLSELALAAGDLPAAIRNAEQCVELADRSGDAFERLATRTYLADALGQAGRRDKAAARFREAEEMSQARQPGYPLLYSLPGYRYCDLLLAQGQAEEVLRRAGQTVEWAKQYLGLLDVALDYLSLGRAHLMLALSGVAAATPNSDLAGADASSLVNRQTSIASAAAPSSIVNRPSSIVSAASELDQAVEGLRQTRRQDYIPRGLLARAALCCATRDFDRARRDLDEALLIATREGMRLHKADCHLEYARLFLAMEDAAQAREHFAVAERMVAEMGYGRRDREVAELEAVLGTALGACYDSKSRGLIESDMRGKDGASIHPADSL
jgi:tetratricopeptide (TPR) repeat protein